MNLSKMDYRVIFFSENDLSIPYYYDRAEELISKFSSGWICNEINDIIELVP